jgi:hypothetical protein
MFALGHADEDAKLLQRHTASLAQPITVGDRNNKDVALERSIG